MLSWRAPVFLLSVCLLLLLPGDTRALARKPTATKPPMTPLTRCTGGRGIGPSDVRLELFDKDQLNQANPGPTGKILTLTCRTSSARGGTGGSRTSSARGSASPKETDQGNTTVVMHGFNSGGQKMKAKGFIEAYRQKGVNLIIVDWSSLARWGGKDVTGYGRAAACAIEVGKYLAHCLDELKVDASTLHLLGHSLGAHGVGMAGRKLAEIARKKLGRKIKPSRVTGMDPAGPGFVSAGSFKNLDIVLDPTKFALNNIPYYADLKTISTESGDFVDIVHSNVGKYGYAEPLGHVDYYVNGGGPIQEECEKGLGVTNIKDNTRSHGYAVNVVVASLQDKGYRKIEPCDIERNANSYTCTSSRRGSDVSFVGLSSSGSRKSSERSFRVFKAGIKPIPLDTATYELTTLAIECK